MMHEGGMVQPVAVAQPVQPIQPAVQAVVVQQPPATVIVQQPPAVVVTPAQPVAAPVPMAAPADNVVIGTPPPRKRRAPQDGFGFIPSLDWKNGAKNLEGFYVSCTCAPWHYCYDPCPWWILCCISPFYMAYPWPFVKCVSMSAVDDDTLKLSWGADCCCPLSLIDPKAAGALYQRDDGEDGRPLGPPDAFTRQDGRETFEVGGKRACAARCARTVESHSCLRLHAC